jgi:anti-sigma factor RsiW
MRHEELKENVFLLHDGELPAAERPATEAHLRGCAECRAALEEWKAAARALFPAPDVRPSEAFVARVMARLEDEGKGLFGTLRAALSPRRLALAGAAAFAALAVFVAAPERRPAGGSHETVLHVARVIDEAEAAEDDAGMGTSIEEYFL